MCRAPFLAVVTLVLAGCSGDPFQSACNGVTCDEGALCLLLSTGPICACDNEHKEADGGTCIPLDAGIAADVDAGTPDAG